MCCRARIKRRYRSAQLVNLTSAAAEVGVVVFWAAKIASTETAISSIGLL